MDTLELWLIRHGETPWNRYRAGGDADLRGVSQPPDAPLSEQGGAQAERLAKRLAGETFDLIYASDMTRTQRTAAVVFGDVAVRLEPRLREVSRGLFERVSEDDLSDAQRQHKKAMKADPHNVRAPEGENYQDVGVRVRDWLSDLPTQGRVAAVTHSGVIQALLYDIVGKQKSWRFVLGNVSLTRLVRYSDKTDSTRNVRWDIVWVGDQAHLYDW